MICLKMFRPWPVQIVATISTAGEHLYGSGCIPESRMSIPHDSYQPKECDFTCTSIRATCPLRAMTKDSLLKGTNRSRCSRP